MSEFNIILVLSILVSIQILCAVIVLTLINNSMNKISNGKQNKFTRHQVVRLKSHRWLVVLLPLIGPIIGLSVVYGLKSGHIDRGTKVNHSGGTSIDSDCE